MTNTVEGFKKDGDSDRKQENNKTTDVFILNPKEWGLKIDEDGDRHEFDEKDLDEYCRDE